MSQPQEKIVQRIKHLMALAANTEGTPEGETARERAMELITKYSIDQALLATDDTGSATIEQDSLHVPGPYARLRVDLLAAIADIYSVQLVCLDAVQTARVRRVAYDGSYLANLYGYAGDVATVRRLAELLLPQLNAELIRAYSPGMSRSRRSAVAKGVIIGFTDGVLTRLKEIYAHAVRQTAQPARTDIALRDRRGVVEEWLAENVPDLTVRKGQKLKVDSDGLKRGQAAAMEADLGQTRVDA